MTSTELPEIGGVTPSGVTTKIRGSVPSIDRALDFGEKVVLLIEAQADDVGRLKETKGGPHIVQALLATTVYEVADSAAAKDLLREARAQQRLADDAAAGRVPLAFDDTAQPAGVVDASGVVLTPGEVLEARGVDLDVDGDTFVIVFAGGGRGLWPEDWAGSGQSVAAPGGFMRPPNAGPGETDQVVKILDAESAEVIDEWTDEDEARRLEVAELVASAAEDAAAVAELEAPRALIGGKPVAEATYKEIDAALREIDDVEFLLSVLAVEEHGRDRKGVKQSIRLRIAEIEGV